ncbi:MAG: tRNA dihydrouridine synthase DusB [Lewinellaceae bacterium]|nr:tRNA dihydrouridine synthase DusB [Lewinellaceae bacterium]
MDLQWNTGLEQHTISKDFVQIGHISFDRYPLLLAPMEDVSDPPFRTVCKANGADMMYTEFISVEGLIRDAVKSQKKLDFSEQERPIGIQMFGADIDSMTRAAEIIEMVKPDLLDINFGCPVKKVVCKLAGAGILQDIPKMVKLTEKVVKSTQLPVTVKTRLGWDEKTKNIVDVAERLQDVGIKALTIHGRTRQQMYKGEADWTLIGAVKNNPRMIIPIIGNGDIDTPEKAYKYRNDYGVDGIMIGRASIGYPWIFREIHHYFQTKTLLEPPTLNERLSAIKTHLTKSVAWKGERLGILEMRRHYAPYLKGLPNIKEFRSRLVTADHENEVMDILNQVEEVYENVIAI